MPGEIVTLIGSNGAGKSTTLRTISGLLRPRQGQVAFEGKRIDRTAADEIVRRGIAQSPEGRRIFPRMTVSENLDLGAFLRKDRDGIAADRERVLELFPRLRERITQKAGTMSGGEQQMLAVARALMAKPKLLLLDEPSMGLAPVLVDLIFETISTIREGGTTVLLVEQNALAGFDVDLFNAVAGKLALKTEWKTADFDDIIPGVAAGRYHLGVSSFTIRPDREEQVTMVSYFAAGTQWAARPGVAIDPDDACGKRVAVQSSTLQVNDLATRSAACTAAGKPAIQADEYLKQADLATAVSSGKDDALN